MSHAAPNPFARALDAWRPLKPEGGMLGFGLLHAVAAGLGQTFFVSLFVPHWLESTGLQRTAFSALYSAATVGSALLLPWIGRGIDRVALPRYAMLVSVGLTVACIGLATAQGWPWLAAALLLLRLCGQGLMSHTGSTATARHFEAHRGKALSIVSLGYPISEMIFPLAATSAIAAIGWQRTWLAAAGFVLFGVLPATQLLLRSRPRPQERHVEDDDSDSAVRAPRRDWREGEVFRNPYTWALTPLLFTPAFVLTGLFFHQLVLAEEQGWSATWLAASFTSFGVLRGISGFAVGPLIDRYGPSIALRLHLAPLGLGVLLLAWTTGPWTAPVYLGLAGVTMGSGGSARTAFMAETYGLQHLGAIRSTFAMLAVLSTAVAPILFGWALDASWPFRVLLWASAAWIAAASAVGGVAARALTQA